MCLAELLSSLGPHPFMFSRTYWFGFVEGRQSIDHQFISWVRILAGRRVPLIWWGCCQAGVEAGPASLREEAPACKWDGDVFGKMATGSWLMLRQRRGIKQESQYIPGNRKRFITGLILMIKSWVDHPSGPSTDQYMMSSKVLWHWPLWTK